MTFYEAVKRMRRHQKAYFRSRKIDDLKIAKHYEKLVDDMLTQIESNQPKLSL
jgi:hypothetical protein